MIENFKGKGNSNGFDKRPEDASKGGRKPSIKKQLEKIALADGWIEFKTEDVQILEDKIKVRVPKIDAVALKLWSWAMSKKGNDSIKAIQMIMNHFDGRPGGKEKQSIQIENTQVNINKTDIQYIVVLSANEVPEEYKDKATYQIPEPDAKELPQPYTSEKEVKNKYNLN